MSAWRAGGLVLGVLSCAAVAANPTAPAEAGRAWQTPVLESIDHQEAIAENNVTAITEDRAGFLWIGSTGGVLRYDGYRFRRFQPSADSAAGPAGQFVRQLLASHDGRLWVASNESGVSVYDPRLDRFSHYRHDPADPTSLPHDGVRALAEDPAGVIYIGTLAGLARWQPERAAVVRVELPGAETVEPRVLALRVDQRGTLWIGTLSGLLQLPSPAEPPIPVTTADAEFAEHLRSGVRALFEIRREQLLVATLDGAILVYDSGRQRFRYWGGERQRPGHGFSVFDAARVGAQLWLAGAGGIRVFDSADESPLFELHYDPSDPSALATSDVRALWAGRLDLVWIGGYGSGLQRYNAGNRALRVVRHREQDPTTPREPSVSSLLELADGRLLLGTRGRGLELLDHQRGIVARLAPGDSGGDLSNGVIIALAHAGADHVWVGTDQGLGRFAFPRGGGAMLELGQLPNRTIRRLLDDPQRGLFIGSNVGLSLLDPAGQLQIIEAPEGGPLPYEVNALAFAADGGLWIGAASGLFLLDPGSTRMRRIEPGDEAAGTLLHDNIVGLLFDRRGQLWVDSGAGLYRREHWDGRSARFRAISVELGIAGQPFGANLLDDDFGRIWTHRFVYDPERQRVYQLRRSDGVDIGTGWFRAYTRGRDGAFYYGGSRGVLRIEPSRFQPPSYQPALLITQLHSAEQTLEWPDEGESVSIPARWQGFEVEFAAIDHLAPNAVRYQARLVGLEEAWRQLDRQRRTVSYSGLWPGEYQLQLRAESELGAWPAQQLSLPLQVAPRFWQTPLALLLAVAALLMLILLLSRLQAHRLRQRATALQQLIDQRTGELVQARDRAEQTLHELRDTQQQLIEAEKLAALGQLVSGVAHEINTPLGVAITATSLLQERGRALREQFHSGQLRRQDIADYLDTADSAGGMIEGNLQRSAQLVQRFKLIAAEREAAELRRFDLAAYLDDVLDTLQPDLRGGGIELHRYAEAGIEMVSEPATLARVITLLVQNAEQHAFDSTVTDPRIDLSVRRLGSEQVEITVADNGRGIAADHLPHVFEPFFTTRRGQGYSGLGLHIAHNQISVRLGGSLQVESSAQLGTRFILQLPRQRAATATPERR